MFLLLLAACSNKDAPEVEDDVEVAAEAAQEAPSAPKKEEGRVGRKDTKMQQAPPVVDAPSAPDPQRLAQEADLQGLLGAKRGDELGNTGLTGTEAGEFVGGGGLGGRGSGLGGGSVTGTLGGMSGGAAGGVGTGAGYGVSGLVGGTGEGLGGLGTKGRGAYEKSPEYKPASPTVAFNWGATTWLSNDDSMSLASAQRLLWAVERGQSVTPGEIRPHEFLNYFSFAADRPARGATFAITGAAERTDADTLSVALAVQAGIPEPAPMALTLVVDRSGSMSDAGKMVFLKRGLKRMVSQLRRGDHVDLVAFDDRIDTMFSNLEVGRDNARILAAIDSLQPRGSTNLADGLRRGYTLARQHSTEDRRRVLLITDALLNTGDVDPDLVSEIGRALDQDHIRLSAVGVGSDVNDRMLDKLTEKGKGAYVYLGSEVVTDRVFGPMFHALTETVAEDVRISLDLPDSLGMARFYGEEASTTKVDVQPVHVHAGTTQLFLEDLRIRDERVSPDDRLVVHMEWDDPLSHERKQKDSSYSVSELLRGDTRNLHKARALMAWTDEIQARGARGESCGGAYDTWLDRFGRVDDDAELAWLDGLLSKTCTRREPVARASYKVKVDSDQVIAEVQLRCGGIVDSDELGAGESVARFDGARAGSCEVVLMGNTPMLARVNVPAVGGEARCTVRAGRVDCAG